MRLADGLVEVEVGARVLVGNVQAVRAEVLDQLRDAGLPHLVAERVQRPPAVLLRPHPHVLQLALPAGTGQGIGGQSSTGGLYVCDVRPLTSRVLTSPVRASARPPS